MARLRAAGPEASIARLVLDRVIRLRPGEVLRVESWNHGLPWARALLVGAVRRGAVPTLVLEDEPAFFDALAAVGARAALRRPVGPAADAVVRLGGPEAFPRLRGLPQRDHDRVVQTLRGGSPRIQDGRRVVRLRLGDATPTAAGHLGVDLDRWRSELLRASLVDPARLAAAGRRLDRALGRRTRLRLRHRNGTDLTVRLARSGRTILSGTPARNAVAELPSGLWRAPIVPGTVEGVIEANRPTYDRYADPPGTVGARLVLAGGVVRQFASDRAGPALAAYARSASGQVQARYLEVGLNPEIRSAPETLELAWGTVTLVVADRLERSDGAVPRFVFRASLSGADVRADGIPWALGSAPPRRGA